MQTQAPPSQDIYTRLGSLLRGSLNYRKQIKVTFGSKPKLTAEKWTMNEGGKFLEKQSAASVGEYNRVI